MDLRVLVIDDEPGICRVIRRILERAGHRVACAETGQKARELLGQDGSYDAVLCDLLMPGVDGISLYRWLARADPKQAQRVVFMTGGSSSRPVRDFLEQVDNLLLVKPFDSEQVTAVVQRAAQSSSSRSPGTSTRR
jgi:CheY-like chemotaxis protein